MSDDDSSYRPIRRVQKDLRTSKKIAALPSTYANLILDSRLKPQSILANAVTVLAELFQDRLRYDVFSDRPCVSGEIPWRPNSGTSELTHHDDINAAHYLQQHAGVMVSPEIAGQALDVVAQRHPFHPVRDYLTQLTWDGTARIDGFLHRYVGVEDSAYARDTGSKFLIAAISRVLSPGSKVDTMPVFGGGQGIKKTTLLERLFHPFFTDELAEFGSKDAAMQLRGKWCIEVSELDAMTRANVERVKGFVSRTTDRYRPPYGRRVIEVPRQVVFAGTVNRDDYLKDETGARRFWPQRCGVIDVEGMVAVRDQLWAEARDRFVSGESWWLENADVLEAARKEQLERYQHDVWAQPIAEFVASKSSVTITDILEHCLGLRKGEWSQRDQNRVSATLRTMSWKRVQKREGLDRYWTYEPPETQRLSPVVTGCEDIDW